MNYEVKAYLTIIVVVEAANNVEGIADVDALGVVDWDETLVREGC